MSETLRVALLRHDHGAGESPERALALALAAAGHSAEIVAPAALPDVPLRLRKIGDRPGRVPGTLAALARGGYDVAHAFTAQDAAVAAVWSRATARPAVFTLTEPLDRGGLADRRLRLATWRVALAHTDAVLAPDASVAESLRRWMAVEARVIAPDAAEDHVALYSSLRRG